MKHWDVLSPIFIQHGAIYGSPIKVAIAHKLVRQIFGVIKSGTAFSKEYA
jgi:hypothetical protein